MTPVSPQKPAVTAVDPPQISTKHRRDEHHFRRDNQHHENLPMVLALLKHDSAEAATHTQKRLELYCSSRRVRAIYF